jgi:hypothetical protein
MSDGSETQPNGDERLSVTAETDTMSDPTEGFVATSGQSQGVGTNQSGLGFYRARRLFYRSLLVFVVAVGMPIISVPTFRHRLSGRVEALREAWKGGKVKPVVVMVGENKLPFPSEFERKTAPPSYPKLPPYFAASQGFGSPVVIAPPSSQSEPARPRRTIRIPRVQEASDAGTGSAANPAAAASETEAPPADDQPKYQQGQMEKEAYDLLLQSNKTLKEMVGGQSLLYRFKSWDALKRDEDTYYVRVILTSAASNQDETFIWEVKLLAKQVTPLSFNARSLANP